MLDCDFVMLGAIHWYVQVLAVLFVLLSLALIGLVLIQKGRGGGLSAAFGGAGGQSAFGSKTGDVFTWITVGVVAGFLILSLVLTKTYRPITEFQEDMGATMQQAPADGAVPDDQTDLLGDETAAPATDDAPVQPPAEVAPSQPEPEATPSAPAEEETN